jgi:hypothetical protein
VCALQARKKVFLERETTVFEPKTLQKHTNIPKIRAEGAEIF